MAGRKNKNAELRKPEILEGYYNVMIKEGIDGTSISKIAKHLGIHPSLILHYFKTKENLRLELIEMMVSKFKSRHLISLDHIRDDAQRFEALITILFSYEWSRTVDPGVHYGFYYQSYRDENIKRICGDMFRWLRDFLYKELLYYNKKGIIRVKDELKAADIIVTLMEGLEFHAQFLSDHERFEEFAETCKQSALALLKNFII
ncbi:MAG: TetR/AcrR family transcriptional regulator [Desulforhopalus sp.]